jgi:hypothetical protein
LGERISDLHSGTDQQVEVYIKLEMVQSVLQPQPNRPTRCMA